MAWRERAVPITPIPDQAPPIARVKDDPTRQDDAEELRPLEGPDGISWQAASR
jgi:hypothetical protein